MNDLTIIYYTGNLLDGPFANAVREHLKYSANRYDGWDAIPIISVSQKPLNFGHNICMGDIGRSWSSLFRQIIAGAKKADTKYIALCEDDVFYPAGHFELRPPLGFHGIYDQNCHRVLLKQKAICLFRGGRSMFLLIGEREKIIENLEGKLAIFKKPADFHGHFEPGKGESDLGLPEFRICPGASRGEAIINICNHGTNMSLKPKRPGDFATDRLPDGRTVDDLIRQWHLPDQARRQPA
jgi:hypothetical protein